MNLGKYRELRKWVSYFYISGQLLSRIPNLSTSPINALFVPSHSSVTQVYWGLNSFNVVALSFLDSDRLNFTFYIGDFTLEILTAKYKTLNVKCKSICPLIPRLVDVV